MKKKDFIFISLIIVFFSLFAIYPKLMNFYTQMNHSHGFFMSFIKFAILATMGEVIGLRIRKGVYNEKGFGLVPRMIVWGFIGIVIKMAFIIFATGTPILLHYSGINASVKTVNTPGFSFIKLFTAFSISTALNLIFAPVFMTFHKITDEHINRTGGTLKGFFSKINVNKIITTMNWEVQWNFVFKKTIPLFWIPAHTFTFMLPPEHRVLFAAILGIILGVFLSIASLKSHSLKLSPEK